MRVAQGQSQPHGANQPMTTRPQEPYATQDFQLNLFQSFSTPYTALMHAKVKVNEPNAGWTSLLLRGMICPLLSRARFPSEGNLQLAV